jgi:Asp-tRNA(Asn)/Glu-tRNA(Gln) amidotransferase A subunit family amidase
MDDLCYLPATDALARFRERSLSPVEYLDAITARIDETDPLVNSVAESLIEDAYAAARSATDLYTSRPDDARPLEGLPVAAKAEQPIAGRLHTEGSLAFADRIAEVTHPVVERVLAAGGIVHVRTTTPEFSCAAITHTKLWGVTRNPWNLHYSPGGSSGGSAAALASGIAPLATGSDIGGSIRIPASFAGVVGYKPPYGRVPDLPPFNLDAYCHNGPMARTVADCALLQNVIVGPHPLDAASVRPAVSIPDPLDSAKGLRVAFAVNLGDWLTEPAVEANTRATAEALRDAGAIVEEVELDLKRAVVARAATIHYSAIFGRSVGDMVDAYGDLLTPYARTFAATYAPEVAGGTLLDGLVLEAEIHARLAPVFERYDALICPTSGVPALLAEDPELAGLPPGDSAEIDPIFGTIMTVPFNILSRCPVLAVPSGWADNGVPTGVQIVGRSYDDATVFRLGVAVETVRPWGYRDANRLPSLAYGEPAPAARV